MSRRIVVNPIACAAHGMCAELLPERITLDPWGYPVIDEEPVDDELLDHARRAAQACPTFALLLLRRETSERRVPALRTAKAERAAVAPRRPRAARARDI